MNLIEPPSPDESGLANLAELVRKAHASSGMEPSLFLPVSLPESSDNLCLELAPGGYVVRGIHYPLSGAPRAVLSALLLARHRCVTADQIEREAIGDSVADDLRQAAKDAVQALRASLRTSTGIEEPILTIGRGRDLAWKLAVA